MLPAHWSALHVVPQAAGNSDDDAVPREILEFREQVRF